MISNNTVGYTKKITVNGLQILAYGAGNWIGPQTFRASDAPDYLHGKLMVAIMSVYLCSVYHRLSDHVIGMVPLPECCSSSDSLTFGKTVAETRRK